jgi:tetratricopeptide (TPR) repeat protein
VKACELTRRVGMELSIYLITGVAGETREDSAATLRLIRRVRPHDGIVSPLVVYPGTALYEEAKRLKGYDDSIWERSRMEGLLVRDDPESILAYRQTEATLREVAALSAYRLEELREHKKAVGGYPAPLLSLGEALEENGDREAAAEEYREILAANPCSLWGHLRLGNLLEAAGKFEVAAAHYRSAVRAVPRYHLPHSLLGSALRRMDRPGEARSEYVKALELYPGDRVARRGLGLIRRSGPCSPIRTYRRKPSTGLTASPHWPAFLQHPIPDGQPIRRASEP